jgi:hypothetical protein
VRLLFLDQAECGFPILCFGYHFDIFSLIQDITYANPYYGMIVNQKNSDYFVH